MNFSPISLKKFLKTIKPAALWWGKVIPKFSYTNEKTAVEYDRRRLTSNRGRYKHYTECQTLFNLLDSERDKILEVGCGTGRITAELIKRGYQVVPTDPSKAMLKQFRKKAGLPEPIEADGACLPFKDSQFPTVIAIRVIWHLPPSEGKKVLSEMKRVSSQSVIFDIANKKRFLGKLLIGPGTYPVILEDFLNFCQQGGLRVGVATPLDVGLPLWLRLLPRRFAEKIFPLLRRRDLFLAKIIAPARYLIKLRTDNFPLS